MRPIIGVNGDCLWLCGDVCHSPPSLSAPRSHGKLRSMLTGTGVGSNFRSVSDLELKPAKLRWDGTSTSARSGVPHLGSGSPPAMALNPSHVYKAR